MNFLYFELSKRKFFDSTVIYVVFSIFFFADNEDKYLTYSTFFILLTYFVINEILQRKKKRYYNKSFKYFPLILLLAWFYGIVVGIIYNNNFIFINNVGIIYFASYYFLSSSSLTNDDLFKIILNLTIASIIIYLINTGFQTLGNLQLLNIGTRLGGYSITGIFAATMLPLLIYNNLFRSSNKILINNVVLNLLLLLLILLVSFFLIASKGIYLSFTVTIILLLLYKKKSFRILKSFFYLVILLYFILTIDFNAIVIFGSEDVSNLKRYELIDEIIPQLTFFGKGWGAIYQGGELQFRNDMGYSSELSYLNLVHKIGVFSLAFFVFYLWIFYQIIKTLKSKNDSAILCGLISMGLITYLFISIGNPTLFAPPFVFMNVIALLMLNEQFITMRT